MIVFSIDDGRKRMVTSSRILLRFLMFFSLTAGEIAIFGDVLQLEVSHHGSIAYEVA